jgi:hypothetical protein
MSVGRNDHKKEKQNKKALVLTQFHLSNLEIDLHHNRHKIQAEKRTHKGVCQSCRAPKKEQEQQKEHVLTPLPTALAEMKRPGRQLSQSKLDFAPVSLINAPGGQLSQAPAVNCSWKKKNDPILYSSRVLVV